MTWHNLFVPMSQLLIYVFKDGVVVSFLWLSSPVEVVFFVVQMNEQANSILTRGSRSKIEFSSHQVNARILVCSSKWNWVVGVEFININKIQLSIFKKSSCWFCFLVVCNPSKYIALVNWTCWTGKHDLHGIDISKW